MAEIIELGYQTSQPLPYNRTQNINQISSFLQFCRTHRTVKGKKSMKIIKSVQTDNFLHFYATINIKGEILNALSLTIDLQKDIFKYEIYFIPRGQLQAILSNEIIKYITKFIKLIILNAAAINFMGVLAVDPHLGRTTIKFTSNIKSLGSNKLPFLNDRIFQLTKFMNQNYIFILYCSNRISAFTLKKTHPNHFISLKDIKQVLTLKNCSVDDVWKDTISYAQQQHQQLYEQLCLWAQPPEQYQQKQEPYYRQMLKKDFNTPFYKITTSSNKQKRSQILNTILIHSQGKEKEVLIYDKGTYAKLSKIKMKYSYTYSKNIGEIQLKDINIDQISNAISFNQILIAKMPNNNKSVNQITKFQKIKWEKNIISNLRTSKSQYLPKYYHTIQSHSNFKDGILMDYIQGETLEQKMKNQQNIMSLFIRFRLAATISRSVWFLQKFKIVHLDLKPSNIMIAKNQHLMTKIIDFGQSYCPTTSERYRSKREMYKHFPGRSFPYCPPETTTRREDFTSKQDVFSLGVLFFQMFFKNYPIPFLDQQLGNFLYWQHQYEKRLLFVPQIVQYLGPSEHYNILASLILSMLLPKEQQRPEPGWIALLFQKISQIKM